jgi:hypothetical protein
MQDVRRAGVADGGAFPRRALRSADSSAVVTHLAFVEARAAVTGAIQRPDRLFHPIFSGCHQVGQARSSINPCHFRRSDFYARKQEFHDPE